MKSNQKNFAIAGGILWGVMMFMTTLLSLKTGYGKDMLDVMSGIYPGYNISLLGSVIGFIYGFFDVFIGIYIFIWLYNWLENRK